MAVTTGLSSLSLQILRNMFDVNLQIQRVSKKIATGSKVPSSEFDPLGLSVSDIFSRQIVSLSVSQQSLAKTSSRFDTIEDAIETMLYGAGGTASDPTGGLYLLKQTAEQVAANLLDNTIGQNTANDIYANLRQTARTTLFSDDVLIRGGLGNTALAYQTVTGAFGLGPNLTVTLSELNVTGVNLQGYAALATVSDYTNPNTPNLITVSSQFHTFAAPVGYGNIAGALASVFLRVENGIATAELWMNRNVNNPFLPAFAPVFTEAISMITGPQVLNFANLGLTVNLTEENWDYSSVGTLVVQIKRNLASAYSGTNPTILSENFTYDIMNLEPENLLAVSTTSNATLFTVDLTTDASAAAAVNIINNAINKLSADYSRVGVLKQGAQGQTTKVSNLILAAKNQISVIQDLSQDELAAENLKFATLQVIQQTSLALLSQSGLNGSLLLRILGVT